MTKQYKYTAAEAFKASKHGIDLTIYGQVMPHASIAQVNVEKGHFEEFYQDVSTFTYYIISGKGTFYLDDEPITAEAGDIIAIPPKTHIHYFGKMQMLLIVSPAFNETTEHHVRFINEDEAPNQK
jgi:mannose-6-phosphate isomerase-like protein (cupin superfamily)